MSIIILTVLITSTGCLQDDSSSNGQAITADNTPRAQDTGKNSPHYNVVKKRYENHDKLFYPQAENYKSELLTGYINQSLIKIAKKYSDKSKYKNVDLDYELTRMDKDILSVLYKGTAYMEGIGCINIQESINLDMKDSTNEIDYENIIKDNEEARHRVRERLDEEAVNIGIEYGLEAEGIRVYFDGKDTIVFFYMPLDDTAREFVELKIPKKDIKAYLNRDFGESPIS